LLGEKLDNRILFLSFTNKSTAKKLSFVYSVTRLGEISPFGRNFLTLGAFFLKNIAQIIWADFFFKKIAQNSP
jgi:hypothetical protein